MKLSKFLSSRTGKRFYNLCYCWGACLVILGAVFKIAHMPYDNLFLMIGLFTEVFIFFISGFDEPAREYKWERVFPLLNDKNANINPHTGVSDTLMTEKYIQQLKRLENNVCKLNETYEAQIKGMTEHAKSLNEMNSEELKKETEKMGLILPEHYDPRLSVRETQEAIKYIRDTFQKEFGKEMNLERISAPLFVEKSSGLNDDLNGVERPVQFDIAGVPGETIEVVHSLAKWKRMALYKYGFQPGEGLYTNMNAIRRDEELDNLHSCYVDQWDWEKVIKKEERTVETLEATVRNIFKIIKHMEHEVWYKYPQAVKKLPEDIYFITSQELEDMYPDKTPKERENLITKEHGCVFLMKIGDKLASGEPHDGRAPDYDDWQLNGDILFRDTELCT